MVPSGGQAGGPRLGGGTRAPATAYARLGRHGAALSNIKRTVLFEFT